MYLSGGFPANHSWATRIKLKPDECISAAASRQTIAWQSICSMRNRVYLSGASRQTIATAGRLDLPAVAIGGRRSDAGKVADIPNHRGARSWSQNRVSAKRTRGQESADRGYQLSLSYAVTWTSRRTSRVVRVSSAGLARMTRYSEAMRCASFAAFCPKNGLPTSNHLNSAERGSGMSGSAFLFTWSYNALTERVVWAMVLEGPEGRIPVRNVETPGKGGAFSQSGAAEPRGAQRFPSIWKARVRATPFSRLLI